MKRWTHRASLTLVTLVAGAFFGQAAWFGNPAPDYSQGASSEFYCANPSGSPITTQAGVSVSSPTLSLYNPAGSGKNLVLLETGIEPTAVVGSGVANFFLAYSTPTGSGVTVSTAATSIAVMTGAQVGKSTGTFATPQGKCQAQGILPATPVAFRYLGTFSTGTVVGIEDFTQGKVVVPPGVTLSIQSSAASAVLAHFLWREDPGN